MNTTTTTKRLPSRVAWVLGSVSLVLAVTASEYLGAGPIGAVVGTAVLMLVLARVYKFASS